VDIPTKKYVTFFTLDKMNDEKNQCEAIKNFLADYAKNSLWTMMRKHKKQVLVFLEKNKAVEKLDALLMNMTKELNIGSIPAQSELYKRLLTIQKMCCQISSDEMKIPKKEVYQKHPRNRL